MFQDMRFELGAEVAQGAEHGAGGELAQRAERLFSHARRQLFDGVDILHLAFALVMRVRISSIRLPPTRQGTHLPHDSAVAKVKK